MLRILPVSESTIDAAYDVFCQHRELPWSLELFTRSINTPFSFIAVDSDVLCGLVIVSKVLDEAELEDICVHKEYRRQGLAKKMLSYCIDVLRKDRVAQLHLEVRQSNQAAIALYESLGFAKTGERPAYYEQSSLQSSKDERETGLIYTLSIA